MNTVSNMIVAAACLLSLPSFAEEPARLVYVLNNHPGGNTVSVLRQNPDASFDTLATYPTGGNGTGTALESQGTLQINESGTLLLAVNAGSNSVTSFRVNGAVLERAGVVSSGGIRPVSVSVRNSLAYVLNQGGAGAVAGFTVLADGTLAPIEGSTRPLSQENAGGAQVTLLPDGKQLLVTELDANRLSLFTLDESGAIAKGPLVSRSRGRGPFGFALDPRGFVLISEAFGGSGGNSSASSYSIRKGRLRAISGAVPTFQRAACWMVVTPDTHYAYTTNTGSNNITGFSVSARGRLKRLNRNGVTADSGPSSAPTELALSPDNTVLFSIYAASASVAAFRIAADGSLSAMGSVPVPAFPVGLVVR